MNYISKYYYDIILIFYNLLNRLKRHRQQPDLKTKLSIMQDEKVVLKPLRAAVDKLMAAVTASVTALSR